MNCQACQDLLSDYYDGQLSGQVASEVEEHLHQCDDCCSQLESFQTLSAALEAVRLLPTTMVSPVPPTWQSVLNRLEPVSPTATDRIASKASSSEHSNWWSTAALVVLTTAASLLLVLCTNRLDQPAKVEIAIDYASLIENYAHDPATALKTLSDRFSGQELPVAQAGSVLGYEPKSLQHLPGGTQLVSTRVLKLPECTCRNGQCSCGPGGCNCAAMLCRRTDGSEFVLIEHGDSNRISFGHLPLRSSGADVSGLTLVGKNPALAASWVTNNRRVTAIGIRNDREAELLASTVK